MKKRELRPHQSSALSRLKSGSILCGSVGSGKSFVAVQYYLKCQAPKDIYVITTAKKRDSLDWMREFANVSISTSADCTTAGVLTVDSWNNLGKYKRVANAFFIFDEQRLVGSGGWVKNFLAISKTNSWILLSATPGDTWLEYIPVFLAHGFYKSRTEFKARHVVYKPYMKFPVVDHYMNESHLVNLRDSILVDMPYESHTKRHLIRVKVDHDRDKIREVIRTRWNPFSDQPLRGASEFHAIMRKVVNSDPDRLVQVRRIMMKHPRVIIFYNFDYELEILRTLKGHISVTEWNGHKHENVPDSEQWVYLVQYSAGAEGWECVGTDAMIFYSQTYSYKLWEQAHGRIDRLHTKFVDLYYYKLVSDARIDLAIQRALESKRNFNERDLSDFRAA